MEHCNILLGKPLEKCLLERPRKACRCGLRMNIRDEKARDRISGSGSCSMKMLRRPITFCYLEFRRFGHVSKELDNTWYISDVIRTAYQSLLYSQYLIQFFAVTFNFNLIWGHKKSTPHLKSNFYETHQRSTSLSSDYLY